MKKLSIFLCVVCAMLLSVGLTSCGSTKAKISAIYASAVMPDETDIRSDTLADSRTFAENTYTLQVGATYHLAVMYVASGGSQYPVLHIDEINLHYDSEIFEIVKPTEKYMQVARYQLTCKRAVDYSAIIVEVGNYSYSVIISAV